MNKKQEIFTIPNLLSFFRLLLIPVIVWLYSVKQAEVLTLLILILSAVTDMADGYIARKWNMVSDLGKALDPVADKLTQVATLGCLLGRYPYIWPVLGILVVKEILTGIMSLYAVKVSGQVRGADWHGKLCTVLLSGTMGLHILWAGIPKALSVGLLILCTAVMLMSGVLYSCRHLNQIKRYS